MERKRNRSVPALAVTGPTAELTDAEGQWKLTADGDVAGVPGSTRFPGHTIHFDCKYGFAFANGRVGDECYQSVPDLSIGCGSQPWTGCWPFDPQLPSSVFLSWESGEASPDFLPGKAVVRPRG